MIPALLMLLQAAATAPLQPPTATADALSPVGKWVVDYEPDACIVSRDFGNKDAPIKFGFRLWPLATTMELVLIGDSTVMKLPELGQLTITTDKGPIENSGHFRSWDSKLKSEVKPSRVTLISADFDAFRNKASAATWQFAYKDESYRFHTGSMGNLMAALADCERDLLKTWKIDPAEFDRPQPRARPIGNPADWFDYRNYPPIAKSARAGGRVVTFLTIDVGGRVTACRPLGKPNSFDLDKTTCDLFIKNGRYVAPVDATGKAVVSYLIAPRVRWSIIGGEPSTSEPLT